MSWLSKGLKKVGTLATKVAPYVGMIPGVGTVAAGALGAAGGLAAGQGLKGALRHGLSGAAGAMGGGAIKGLGGGVGGLAKGGLGAGLKKIGSAAINNPDLLLAGGSMLMGARQQGQANKAADRAMAMREQAWNDFAPIRKIGIDRMQNTQRPDLSAIYRNEFNPLA